MPPHFDLRSHALPYLRSSASEIGFTAELSHVSGTHEVSASSLVHREVHKVNVNVVFVNDSIAS